MSAPERPSAAEELPGALAQLADPELVPAQRRRVLRRLARQLPAPRRLRRVPDTLAELTPYIPVRGLAALQLHHPGLGGDLLADRLVRNAARATAGVGAASGALAAVKWTAPPTLLTAPVLLCAETVAVVAIELKLVGELHEVYGSSIPGPAGRRAAALLQSWSQQRGVTPLMLSSGGLGVVVGGAARRELTERLARRFRTNLPTLAPLLAGAAVGGYLNQRATRALARALRADLASAGTAAAPAGGPGTAGPLR